MILFILFYLFIYFYIGNILRGKSQLDDDEEEGEEDEEEEEEEEKEEKEDEKQTTELVARANQEKRIIDDEVKAWRTQSPWLFLLWKNQPMKRPGKVWIDFVGFPRIFKV